MKRVIHLFFLLLLMNAISLVQAAPRIGLVLSGGGARGSAHIGVLRVLEEMRIPIHAIVGTSMGSLVGGAYAGGVPVAEMERRVTTTDWDELFNDDPPRVEWPERRKQRAQRPTWDFTIGLRDTELHLPKGAMAGQKVQLFFADLVQQSEGVGHYDELPIPFRAIATNLENGRMKVFDRGPLAEAMRASMSVPGLFAPMETEDGGIYVDGGLVRNLPVDVVRGMDVDVVIAVNLGSSYMKREELGTIVGVAGQMIVILTEQNVERSLKELDDKRDILIVPELGDITSGDFKRGVEAIAIGEQAARAAAPRLAGLSLSEAGYAAWRKSNFDADSPGPLVVDEVQVTGLENVNPRLFDTLKEAHAGKPLDRAKLDKEIQALYGYGDFERISYRLAREGGSKRLMVDAVEKSWGPGYLSFGLGIFSDFEGDNRFNIRGTYRRTWLNQLGAEWITDIAVGNESGLFTEFYQPFDLERSGFLAPYLDIEWAPVSIFQGNDRIARYGVRRSRIGVDLGTTFGTGSELRVGAFLGTTRFEVDTGDLLLPEGGISDSGVRLRFVHDTLDSAWLPRSGDRIGIDLTRPLAAFGADREYTRLEATWRGAWKFGDDSLIGNLRGGTSLGDRMPYYEQFDLGGFLRLSGYANEQFRGNEVAYANLVYKRQISTLTPPLGRGLYMGGSLEYGRLWDVTLDQTGTPLNPEQGRYGGSVFFGADTWLGPFYLGLGLSGEGDRTFYLLLGQP